MLMHHSDAESAGLPGRGDSVRLAGYPDLTSIACNQAIGDMYQGGLAGTVLSKERVHLALIEPEIGAAECLYRAKSLGYANELEGRGHSSQSPVGWS
jgi:hypothetical protein